MNIKKYFISLAFAAAALTGVASTWPMQAETADRSADVRAAMLINFARYADWPKGRLEEGQLRICFSEGADLEASLLALQGREINGRTIIVRSFADIGAEACDLAYISGPQALSETTADLLSKQVLVISAETNFARHGIIEFIEIGRQTRFKINNTHANMAGIHLSSRLLRLAVEVR